MTNREKLAQMSNQELAVFICTKHKSCTNCIGREYCVWGAGHGNGVLAWLESEAEEDNEG